MNLNVKELLSLTLILKSLWTIAKTEYTSALIDLEPLLNTQGELAKILEKYLELEEKRLEKIARYKDEYNKLYKAATRDVDVFLSNPVNAFVLVKRLTMDWKNVLNLMDTTSSKDIIKNVNETETFPTYTDLDETAAALLRLQDTYLLNTTQLSRGEIPEMRGTAELTASDCLELGLQSYAGKVYDLALLWMQEALERVEKDELQSISESVLFDHMSFCAYALGKVDEALNLTHKLVAAYPDHPYAKKNLMFYENAVLDKVNKPENATVPETKNSTDVFGMELMDYNKYKRLCRGDRFKSPAEESKLTCRYITGNSKYLLLQPVKEETLNLDPWIVVYHDVIRDRDIELLKELAGPTLERATVLDPFTGKLEYAPYRISKSGWLADDDHPRVTHTSLMIEEITGLETDTAEFLQINKYGLGGHYEGHYDFRREGEADAFAEFGTRNRIATWLFYLSDVDAGGSTVFPFINVQAKPVKGSAAFWYNLYKSGDGDLRTLHAACPVLSGIKWVANKWLHEKDQEFRRPCSLNRLE